MGQRSVNYGLVSRPISRQTISFRLPHAIDFSVPTDGWLAFIINEAILSPRSFSDDSRLFYSVLKQASEVLSSDVRHQIPLRSISLIWYADSAGAFRIAIQVR